MLIPHPHKKYKKLNVYCLLSFKSTSAPIMVIAQSRIGNLWSMLFVDQLTMIVFLARDFETHAIHHNLVEETIFRYG